MGYFHIWFVTKYRKALLEGDIEKFVRDIFAECIQRHKYNVLELETNRDHVHMLVGATDKKELSAVVRTLKAVSAKEVHETPCFRMGNTRCNEGYHTRKRVEVRKNFWARRYGWKEIGENEINSTKEYIRNQKNQK